MSSIILPGTANRKTGVGVTAISTTDLPIILEEASISLGAALNIKREVVLSTTRGEVNTNHEEAISKENMNQEATEIINKENISHEGLTEVPIEEVVEATEAEAGVEATMITSTPNLKKETTITHLAILSKGRTLKITTDPKNSQDLLLHNRMIMVRRKITTQEEATEEEVEASAEEAAEVAEGRLEAGTTTRRTRV